MKPAFIFVCALWIAGCGVYASAQNDTLKPGALARSTQAIVVTTPNWSAVEGRLQRYERATTHDKWHPVGAPISIVVGKNGLGWASGAFATDDDQLRSAADPIKKEGDGKSPAGIFDLGTAFGYSSQPLPGLKMTYLHLTESIECVDDTRSNYYNRIVDRSAITPDWNSSEHMRNVGEVYRWGIVVDFNGTVTGIHAHPPEPGDGSCVFLHIWQGDNHGTVGCTAMPQTDLATLLVWLDPTREPRIIQLPDPIYQQLANRWMLPKAM